MSNARYFWFILCLLLAVGAKPRGLDIATVLELRSKNYAKIKKTSHSVPSNEKQKLSISQFKKTQTGAHILRVFSQNEMLLPSTLVEKMSDKNLQTIFDSGTCDRSCSKDFRDNFLKNKELVSQKLSDLALKMLKNEVSKTHENFVFYHGFPNDFRMYQDVLRLVKSYEYLEDFQSTYPFRNFDPDYSIQNKSQFLAQWWQKYVEHAKENNEPVYAVSEPQKSLASSVGLHIFPDSISFAQNHLISANVSFFGNTLSPLNSSVFFLVNSASANRLDIVDTLTKELLRPYVLADNKEELEKQLETLLKGIKANFLLHLGQSGGQLAQIFINKNVVDEITFVAFNGGEPFWTDKETHTLVLRTGEQKVRLFKPQNIFWPSIEILPKIELTPTKKYLSNYVSSSENFLNFFDVEPSRVAQKRASKFLASKDQDIVSQKQLEEFVFRDLSQSRIFPEYRFMLDESLVNVQIYSFNEPSLENMKKYQEHLAAMGEMLMANFLAKATSQDFKKGHYPLKDVFIKVHNAESK